MLSSCRAQRTYATARRQVKKREKKALVASWLMNVYSRVQYRELVITDLASPCKPRGRP